MGKIKNAKINIAFGIKFKSLLEKRIYETLQREGFKPLYEPTTFTLWDGFTPITPFYDKETDTQYKRRVIKDKEKNRLLSLRTSPVIGIRYTPDFYFKYKKLDVYIEGKGKENEVYYIKKKLFRKYLDDRLNSTGQRSMFFEIYTLKQLSQAIEIIRNYV